MIGSWIWVSAGRGWISGWLWCLHYSWNWCVVDGSYTHSLACSVYTAMFCLPVHHWAAYKAVCTTCTLVNMKNATSHTIVPISSRGWSLFTRLAKFVIKINFTTFHLSNAVLPSQYSYPTNGVIRSVNGSNIFGLCLGIVVGSGMITCTQPNTSVLFDGSIEKLTGLDSDTWASQLFTLERVVSATEVTFDFSGTPGYNGVVGVEVAMFNCPGWGIGPQSFQLLEQQNGLRLNVGSVGQLQSSCSSLVTAILCLQQRSVSSEIVIQFNLDQSSDQVLIAEVIFHSSTDTCQPATSTSTPTEATPNSKQNWSHNNRWKGAGRSPQSRFCTAANQSEIECLHMHKWSQIIIIVHAKYTKNLMYPHSDMLYLELMHEHCE